MGFLVRFQEKWRNFSWVSMQLTYFLNYDIIYIILIVLLLSSCTKSSTPWRGDIKSVEKQPAEVIESSLTIKFIHEIRKRPFGIIQIFHIDTCKSMERDIYEEMITRRRNLTLWERNPWECALLAPLTLFISGFQCFSTGSDVTIGFDKIEFGSETTEKNVPTGKLIKDKWRVRRWQCIVEPWTVKFVDITMYDIDLQRTIWHWKGTTDQKGKIYLAEKEHRNFLGALRGVIRGDALRGHLRLSSEETEYELPLEHHEIKDRLKWIRRH